jgi:toxin ParE1/3/4
MNSFSIHWTPFALECLDEIFEYIRHEAKSIIPAQKLIQKIFESTDQLKHFPFSGAKEPLLIETGQESRYLVINNYKIIYQVENKNVIITDVFHTKQNPEKIKNRGV